MKGHKSGNQGGLEDKSSRSKTLEEVHLVQQKAQHCQWL